MPFALQVPDEYGYVLLVATSTFFVNIYHGVLTSAARRKSGIKYPVPYASNEVAEKDPKAFAFNCAQRAHANFTENLTPFLGALLISGLRFPLVSAGLGAGWAFSRILYAFGYAGSGPQGRMKGSVGHFVFDSVLKLMALYTTVMVVLEK